MSNVEYPDGFAWPPELTPGDVAWLQRWLALRAPVHCAQVVKMRDPDADDGVVVALVLDTDAPDDELRPFAVMATLAPTDAGRAVGIKLSGSFSRRAVIAMEWPRFESLVASGDVPAPAQMPCSKCGGRGWYPEVTYHSEDVFDFDERERYCDCPAGDRRKAREATPVTGP